MKLTPWKKMFHGYCEYCSSLDGRLEIRVYDLTERNFRWIFLFDGKQIDSGTGRGWLTDAKTTALRRIRLHLEPWAAAHGLYTAESATSRAPTSEVMAASHTVALDGLPEDRELEVTAHPSGCVVLYCKLSDDFGITVEVISAKQIRLFTPNWGHDCFGEDTAVPTAIDLLRTWIAFHKSKRTESPSLLLGRKGQFRPIDPSMPGPFRKTFPVGDVVTPDKPGTQG